MKKISDMTELSREMFNSATSRQLNLSQAVELLKSESNIRRVRDTLSSAANIPLTRENELQSFLISQLSSCIPDVKPDSIRRKVQMWMKDDALTIKKQSAIQIAFALHLNVTETDILLKRLCEEGLHWRDPEEIVCIYSLMHNRSYQEALTLYEEIKNELSFEKAEENSSAKMIYTERVKNRVSGITSIRELKEYLLQSRDELGKLHNTAYALFMEFLNLLGMPKMDYTDVFQKDFPKYSEKPLVEIKKYASREIMDTYLYRRFIPIMQKKSKEKTESETLIYNAMQRNIRQNWPDEVTLSKMIHRETDVTRKVLILLFLATDGGESEYADDYAEDMEPDELFCDTYERLNMMLNDCGFSELDPRTQFDWMVLYCICVTDNIFIDGKIQRFLAEIFPQTGTVPDMSDTDEGT